MEATSSPVTVTSPEFSALLESFPAGLQMLVLHLAFLSGVLYRGQSHLERADHGRVGDIDGCSGVDHLLKNRVVLVGLPTGRNLGLPYVPLGLIFAASVEPVLLQES